MKLPEDAIIAPEKMYQYLLVPQARGDKSAFLAKAGYHQAAYTELSRDIRSQLLPLDAVLIDTNEFGEYFEIRGTLTGPNGIVLWVRSVWMKEHLSGRTKFITLMPEKRRY